MVIPATLLGFLFPIVAHTAPQAQNTALDVMSIDSSDRPSVSLTDYIRIGTVTFAVAVGAE